jgi:hypothetical protein
MMVLTMTSMMEAQFLAYYFSFCSAGLQLLSASFLPLKHFKLNCEKF